MLLEIPFYIVMFSPVILLIGAIMMWLAFIDKVTAKPKAPPHVDTPEEAAARKARVLAMLAQMEKSRLASHQI